MILTEIHKQEFENFLSSCDPKLLRKTIQYLYFSLTMDKNNKGLMPDNFDEMSNEVYLLLEFLEQLEEPSKSQV